MADDRLIGELLVQRGVASRAAVEEASVAAHAAGERLCSRLLDAGVCDERDLAGALAVRFGLPGIDLSRSVLDLDALDLVPRSVAEADLLLPLSTEGGRIHVAVDSPARAEQVVTELRFVTGREVSIYAAVRSALVTAIERAYAARDAGDAVWRGRSAGPGLVRLEVVTPGPEGTPVALDLGAPEADAAADLGDGPEIEITDAFAEGQVVAEVRVLPGPVRILVVDDEPAIRLLVQRALQHHGYAVETAADGEEALGALRRDPPDLLLLDAMLPKVHGFEVARKVRSEPATRHIPIVIMTAVYRGWRFAQDARETYGAEDYVEKPFRVDDLVRRIEAVLEASVSRDQSDRAEALPWLEKGRTRLASGEPAEAAAAFAEAVRLDPFSAEGHYLLGKALRGVGDAFRAMTALERAVEIRPGMLPALKALSATYLDKGFRAKAAETLERAVRAAPDDAARELLRAELLKLL